MTSSTLRVVRSNTTAADAYDKHVAAISIDGDRVGEIPLGGIRTFLSRQGSTKPAFDSAATSALEESWQRARKRHHHRHVHKSAVCQRPAEHPSPQPLLVVANQLKRCMLRAPGHVGARDANRAGAGRYTLASTSSRQRRPLQRRTDPHHRHRLATHVPWCGPSLSTFLLRHRELDLSYCTGADPAGSGRPWPVGRGGGTDGHAHKDEQVRDRRPQAISILTVDGERRSVS